jgi:hypothetical protein
MKKVLFVLTLSALFTACTSVETRDVKQDSIKAVDTTKSCVEDIDTTIKNK